ncbi:MAG: alpha/beta hydrolase [Betaproteobacteria bacterium]|nr:alpha/beta hydrolase [Betaproteobacteria bacterium]
MPIATVRGVALHYEVLGTRGPWVALSPGGRRAIEGVESLAKRIAGAGYRVLVHDRRNCGASDVVIEGNESENAIWADDLHELLKQQNAFPSWIGGSSSGCRLALLFALRHPQAVRGLLLWRVTGGLAAAKRLARRYYGQYIEIARAGGMAAVCATEEFAERIRDRPENHDRLMRMDPARFIEVMSSWNRDFLEGAEKPVIGATEAEIRSIRAPACIVPGNDLSHLRSAAENLGRLMPDAEVHPLITKHYDLDVAPREEWDAREADLATIFLDFMKRVEARAPAPAR